MAETDFHVHITWDTEPTEEAKTFIRTTVLETLQEVFEGKSWVREFIQAEVQMQLVALTKDPRAGIS